MTSVFVYRYERSIIWSDPEIGVQWGGLTTDQLLLSGKDSEAMSLEAATPELREIYSQFAL